MSDRLQDIFAYIQYDELAMAKQGHARTDVVSLLTVIRDMLDPAVLKGCKNHQLIQIATYAQHAQKALEETYMWIGKMIRDHQIIRNGPQPDVPERGEEKTE